MRPVAERRFTCQLSSFIAMYAEEPVLLVVAHNGQVSMKMPAAAWSTDGAVYLDGISFVAERTLPAALGARTSARKKARKRATR
jgi:hypothetical protein